jgi:CxxC motif-containing protein (DUF1111 family)
MRRLFILGGSVALSLVLLAQGRQRLFRGVAPVETVAQNAGAPLTGLSTLELNAFNTGRGVFGRNFNAAAGLGPVFNDDSCGACHNGAAPGGGSNRTVTRFATRVNGVYDPLASLGGSLEQSRAIGPRNGSAHAFVAETVPAQASVVVLRRTTPLFGLGLVDATPDATFVALAAGEAARGDGIVGRVNMVDNIRAGMKTAGRFGWKAQVPTLVQFSGDALVNEMGITTPDFPNENCPQGNCAELAFNPAPGLNDNGNATSALSNFMTALAAPARGPQNAATAAGEQTFTAIGCAACHTASLTTGSSTIAALDHKIYHPYSDFLLHDMGTLGDGLEMGDSTANEMRTEPLWGLRFVNRYLHDGRATTLDQAITAHAGQAGASRDQYIALTPDAKQQLLAFLQSL